MGISLERPPSEVGWDLWEGVEQVEEMPVVNLYDCPEGWPARKFPIL